MKNFGLLLLPVIGLLGIIIPSPSYAQIQVTFPQSRAVFQRDSQGLATIAISGNYVKAADKIEVRAKAASIDQGKDIDWIILDGSPNGGIFTGTVSLSQGWYSLEIRATSSGNVVGSDTIERLGVGEVFIISGQSNAQGMDDLTQVPLAPAATDDRVNYIDYNNEGNNSLEDPPTPVFKQLQLQESIHILGPRGHTAWCWGLLGDLLAKKLNVPILFINTAWSGTSIQNWLDSSRGIETYSVYSDLYTFPTGMPYANLRLSVQNYANQYGARAILWMLGESDTYPVNMGYDDFKNKLETLIATLNSTTGTKIPWMIARTSRILDGNGNSVTSQSIINAQNAVISELGDMAFAGPETDNLPVTRIDGIHFYGSDALHVLANAWSEQLSTDFFSANSPLLPGQVGKITSQCSPDNSSITLRLPDGYSSYIWSVERNGLTTEQDGQSINIDKAGKYSAKVKDQLGNTLRTEAVIIPADIRPIMPVINETGLHQVCNDSTFTFSVNPGQDLYEWYKADQVNALHTGLYLDTAESGTYFVKAHNVLGCYSEPSAPVSLIVRDKIIPATIIKDGPFSLKATTSHQGQNINFTWFSGTHILPDSGDIITIRETGGYSVNVGQKFEMNTKSLICYSARSNQVIIEAKDLNDNFVVFPNPGNVGEIFVESKIDAEKTVLTIFDMSGRIVNESLVKFKRFSKVPLSVQTAGQYILKIMSGSTDQAIHFIAK